MAFTIDVQALRTRAANSANAASPARAARAASSASPDLDPYAAFTARHDALLSAGLDEEAAFRVAEAMCMRQPAEDVHVCVLECRHYRRGWCMNSKSAGVGSQLGELAFALQRCSGFAPAANL